MSDQPSRYDIGEYWLDKLTRESAISPESIKRARYFEIRTPRDAAKFCGVPKEAFTEGHFPALVIPDFPPFSREPVGGQIRFKSEVPTKKNGKERLSKCMPMKGRGVTVHAPWQMLACGDDRHDAHECWFHGEIPITHGVRLFILTEGAKKAQAACDAGVPALSIPGVTQWHTKGNANLLPGFCAVGDANYTHVVLAFDEDRAINGDVAKQQDAVTRALRKAGYLTFALPLPENEKLDDCLAKRGKEDLMERIADALAHYELKTPPEDAPPSGDDPLAAVWPHLRMQKSRYGEDPTSDIDNYRAILDHHPDTAGAIAFDERADREVILRRPPWAAANDNAFPRAIHDVDALGISEWMVRIERLRLAKAPSAERINAVVARVAHANRYDPVVRRLESIAWDRTPRVDLFLCECFGAGDSVYTRECSRVMLLQMAARALYPGCQADVTVILQGEQGDRKSTALAALAGGDDYYDALTDIEGRDAADKLHGPWIVEIAELEAFRRSEITALKGFLTTRHDVYRPPYGRRKVQRARRCVFVGTTNASHYLTDATGNRRYMPVATGRVDIERVRQERDQVLAEAVHRVRADEPWYTRDEQLLAIVRAEADDRRAPHPWEDIVRPWLGGRSEVATRDIVEHISRATKTTVTHRDESVEIPKTMAGLGWVRRKIGPSNARVNGYAAPRAGWRGCPALMAGDAAVGDVGRGEVGRGGVGRDGRLRAVSRCELDTTSTAGHRATPISAARVQGVQGVQLVDRYVVTEEEADTAYDKPPTHEPRDSHGAHPDVLDTAGHPDTWPATGGDRPRRKGVL